MYFRTVCVMAALAFGAAACGDDDGPVDASMIDGAVDGGVDSGMDAGMDAMTMCVDDDEDGYGDGCAAGLDCDDSDANVSPAATEVCDGVDNDCNDATDDGLTGPSCALTEGVCAGATARCGGADGFLECDTTDYGDDYEAEETACDGLDNDCDGTTDEDCPCTDGMTQACGSDVGVCMAGTQTCADSMWGPCEGEVGPMGETCDGMDNDCDGSDDEAGDLVAPDCPLQLGVCAGSTRECGGAAGWIACSGIGSYGGDYEASETLCDGLDNDCDGVTDEGCECIDGTMQACGTDVGACSAGVQTCTAGAFGACAGEVPPGTEECNGIDDDCDGTADDGLIAPSCALQMGVCAGSTQPCNGASGFGACEAADYGPNYEETETACDGQDNDCDGEVDEGCDCIDGNTQACGLSTGVCERGTQTCASGMWGMCIGGVEPSIEECNGFDDDCNGSSDDNLTAPPCALDEGVCAGTTQRCGGGSGWLACTPADYGPDYIAAEDGAANEGVCDGLDNDCDGTVDEGCSTSPLVSNANDLVLPSLHNQHLVYMQNFDGNWDIVFADLNSGTLRRLTATAENEENPRVYGDYVVYTRGADAAQRVVLYDLEADTETTLSSRQSGSPDIARGTIVYDDFDGTQWDVYLYDIAMGTSSNLFSGGTTDNEIRPSIRGAQIAYVSDTTGTLITEVVDFAPMTPTVTQQMPAMTAAAGQLNPILDYTTIGWTDGRNVVDAMPDGMSNWDVYGAWFVGADDLFPAEAVVANGTGAQILTDIDGSIHVLSDMRTGDWNPAISSPGGTPQALSMHPGTQADPSISGALIVWEDNRRGTFDIYATNLTGLNVPDTAGQLVVNEILADPAPGMDANGDGSASTTQDEYIEIVNNTGAGMDISGGTLSDAVGVRHTFPARTVVPAGASIVVFGGGAPAGLFGGAIVQVASAGQLGLNNGGDTVTLSVGGTVIDTVTYGGIGGMNEAIVEDGGTFVLHSTVAGASGPISPGETPGGFGF